MAIRARFTFPAGAEMKRKTGWLSEFPRSNAFIVPGRLSESSFEFFAKNKSMHALSCTHSALPFITSGQRHFLALSSYAPVKAAFAADASRCLSLSREQQRWRSLPESMKRCLEMLDLLMDKEGTRGRLSCRLSISLLRGRGQSATIASSPRAMRTEGWCSWGLQAKREVFKESRIVEHVQ